MGKYSLAATAAFACVAAASTPALAAAVITGTVPGPDSGFSIALVFTNEPSSTLDITSLTVDISTATPEELIWDGNPLSTSGTASGALVNVAGADTGAYTFSFNGWNPGEDFRFTGDPDTPGNAAFGATVFNLLGSTITFGFSDGSSQVYAFVDDPAPQAGLTLGPVGGVVPEPGVWALMIAGFGLVGASLRRRRDAIA